MKLDEWTIRKNRQKRKAECKEGNSGTASSTSEHVPSSCSSPRTPNSSLSGEYTTSNESSPVSTLSSPQNPLDTYHQSSQLETMPSTTSGPSPFPHIVPNTIPEDSCRVSGDLGPIVNSSLMFFSLRTHSKSLQLLAKFPRMAPRAIEILLRNWKPGGEYMDYAQRFLKEKEYCETLLSVNWTRWSHHDETLFDLIDIYVPPDDRIALTKAILRADLPFKKEKLETLCAAWAPTWRLALQETKWNAAKTKLFTLEVHNVLLKCALEVAAESFLERNKSILVDWKGGDEPFPESARSQYMEILKDCRELEIEVDPALQRGMRLLWMT